MKTIKFSETNYIIDKSHTLRIQIGEDTSLVISSPEIFELAKSIMNNMLTERKVPISVMNSIHSDIEINKKKVGRPKKRIKLVKHNQIKDIF